MPFKYVLGLANDLLAYKQSRHRWLTIRRDSLYSTIMNLNIHKPSLLLVVPLLSCVILLGQGLPHPGVLPPSKLQGRATASTPASANPAVSKTFTFTDQGSVTAAYLRLNHPEVLFGITAEVKAGRLPSTQLRGLLSSQLQGRLSAATSNPKIRPASLALTTTGGATSHAPGAWQSALAAHGLQMREVEHAPASLVFPECWDKQTVTAVLRVTSNTDGPLTVALGPKSPFTIQSLTIYDGLIVGGSMGQMPARKVAAKVTRPPWMIATNAGQDVEVRLAFSPHFDLFNFTAGTYKDTLSVTGTYWNPGDPKEPSWSLKVPVTGRFDGLALDVIVLADEWHPEVISEASYDPSVPLRVPLGFHLLNFHDAVTGTLSGEGLPAGVSVQPATITVGKVESKAVRLDLVIDRQSAFYLNRPMEVPVPLSFAFHHGGKTVPTHLDLTFYQGFHQWHLSGTCGSVDFSANLNLTAAGDFYFNGNAFNNNLFRPVNVAMLGGFGGSPLINCAFNVDSNSSASKSYGWNTPNVQSHFLTWAHQPLTLKVEVQTH